MYTNFFLMREGDKFLTYNLKNFKKIIKQQPVPISSHKSFFCHENYEVIGWLFDARNEMKDPRLSTQFFRPFRTFPQTFCHNYPIISI